MSEKATKENSMNGIHTDELNDQTYKGKSNSIILHVECENKRF
jgi:hypothetical protein